MFSGLYPTKVFAPFVLLFLTRLEDHIRDRLIPATFMRQTRFIATTYIWAGAAVLLTTGIASLPAQGQDGGRTAQALFSALDTDKDGTLTRPEMESSFNSWFTAWDKTHSGTLTQAQILAGISTLLPAPPAVKPGQANTFNPAGNSTPIAVPQAAVDAMMAALPTAPGSKPMHERRLLVLAHTGAGGFVHASIPLAAKAVEALGKRAVYGPRPSVTTRRISTPITSRNTTPFSWTVQLRVFLTIRTR